ncbi:MULTISPECIES: TerB family tellurite resistance protein [Niastella]|uniref:TerB family tellurite resistance protein n=1 Tax=Niastella soli TaxID=2821487 RepID=A0ABS3Z250_9BACT|nr:TerB family tellurite resistance protein [Niastella soli]MBO9204204.1 TerB family tellurite resistance protein [Niastella soli]
MKSEIFQQLLFRTAVTTIAVDGEIHEAEMEEVKSIIKNTAYFLDFEYDLTLKEIIGEINTKGKEAINSFLSSLPESEMSEQQKIILLDVILRMIEADKGVHPNEVQFLQLVKARIKLSEELLIIKFPKQIDYFIGGNYGVDDIFDIELNFT